MNTVEIDGVRVEREEFPASHEELAHIMKQAFDAGMTMIPVGGGTRLHLGNIPRSAGLAIHTSRLQGIVEYEPDNMTVTVSSGTPLQELQKVLRASNQFLPLDPPHAAISTLGGIVASNGSGPIRFRYGTVRDLLIGVRIAHPDGSLTKAGGKLVKNVTGYDMCKLYTGSLGTLGILAELTFKVQPLPESLATVLIGFAAAWPALEAAQSFLRSDLLPDAMELWNRQAFRRLLDPGSDPPFPWILMLRFGEVEPAVRWQVDRVKEISPETGGEVVETFFTQESGPFWEGAASARAAVLHPDETLVKCSVLYQSTADTARKMEEIGERLGARTSLFCHAGTYVLYGRYRWDDGDARPADELRAALHELRRHTAAAGGHTVIEKVGPEVKNALDVWGYEAPALEIMKRIKREFDPKGLLNPGRFVGGI